MVNQSQELANLESLLNSQEISACDAMIGAFRTGKGIKENFSQDIYTKLAKYISNYKIKESEVKRDGDLLFFEGKRFGIQIIPEKLSKQNYQHQIIDYVDQIKEEIIKNNLDGVVYFLPFSMNSKHARNVIDEEIPTVFISLNYTAKSVKAAIPKFEMRYRNVKKRE